MNPESILPLADRFTAVLATAAEPLTVNQIAELTGVGSRNVRAVLAVMRHFGAAQRHDGSPPTWTLTI